MYTPSLKTVARVATPVMARSIYMPAALMDTHTERRSRNPACLSLQIHSVNRTLASDPTRDTLRISCTRPHTSGTTADIA